MATVPTVKSVKRYTIDLDSPPESRWDQIIFDYKDQWKRIEELLKDAIKTGLGSTLGPAIEGILRYIMSSANKVSSTTSNFCDLFFRCVFIMGLN